MLSLIGLALVLGLAAGIPASRQVLLDLMPPKWRIALAAWRYGIDVDHGVRIAMPDATTLSASLYRPRGATQPLPTVLVRLPYHRLRYREAFGAALFFARNGYAVLVQDLRGTGDSGGEQLPWRDAASDGVATLDWIAAQPWSDGKVGTFGCSALGETQFVLAARRHPRHLAMVPSGAGGAVGSAAGRHAYFGLFEGGVFQLASGFGWLADHGTRDPRAAPARAFDRAAHLRTLPVSALVRAVRPAPNAFDDYLATPLGDAKWSEWGFLGDADRGAIPALVINTWGDQTVGDTLALAEAWRRADPAIAQKVVIGPGDHCEHEHPADPHRFGELPVRNAARPYREWALRWFDHWLRGRGDGLAELRPYTYFMLGEDRWRSADNWPPREARLEPWYLTSAVRANSRRGDGTLGPQRSDGAPFDEFRYDPANPAPTRGGPVCCTGELKMRSGPADQADVENRDDVLVYTSAPLERDLLVAGPLVARLNVSSSAPDTDVVARLVHVWPDGRALGIQEGALRLRYRDGFAAPAMMQPGQRYEVAVDMRSIAYRFPRGHRVRLQVTSSSFPRLERNLNTGARNNADEKEVRVAVNRVHHDALGASVLVLPVLPE